MSSIKIKGYRPFKEILFRFDNPQVIVGANGAGKSSLFEFLKFLRDACYQEIPPEIVSGSIGQQIFHKPGDDKFWWSAEFNVDYEKIPIRYQGELMGPIGAAKIIFERVITAKPLHDGFTRGYSFLNFKNGCGYVRDPGDGAFKRKPWDLKKPNQLGLGAITDSGLHTLYNLREYIRNWRFYNSFSFNNANIRKSVPTSQNPILYEDAGNLGAVLFNLMTEHPGVFDELKSIIKLAIPGFKDILVKARGGPGEVMAMWREDNVDSELCLADLSDGTLRFIAWAVLCLMPSPPALICIDEPDQGVHPRTLPILAGLFNKASERTQIILATHSSYFLTQFELSKIMVMKKDAGQSRCLKAQTSKILLENLAEFGTDELEKMHKNDELVVDM